MIEAAYVEAKRRSASHRVGRCRKSPSKCFGSAHYVVDHRITAIAKHEQSQMAKRQPKNSAAPRRPCSPNKSNRTDVNTTSTMAPISMYTTADRVRRPVFALAS
jgi:hypothetical protein